MSFWSQVTKQLLDGNFQNFVTMHGLTSQPVFVAFISKMANLFQFVLVVSIPTIMVENKTSLKMFQRFQRTVFEMGFQAKKKNNRLAKVGA
jgi:hypothetical protein